MTKVNREIVAEILDNMPQEKKEVLNRALNRNLALTSSRVLSLCEMTIYKEGWLVTFTGTRCSFTVWAGDNDGAYRFTRKPNESKLNKLYKETQMMNESDFDRF